MVRAIMSALIRQPESSFRVRDWHAEVLQRLDEAHLVAVSDVPARRVEFAAGLARFLAGMRQVEVCPLYGQSITDLETLCQQMERALPGPRLERRIDGPRGLTSFLRQRTEGAGRPAAKFRYYLWHDADVLLQRSRPLFAKVADMLAGVAAEAEYASDDVLLIHRGVFVGSSLLELYAGDQRGQFRSWLGDGLGEPFWQVVTGLDEPPFTVLRIDSLV
jgi:hypothetical protein